MTVISMCGIGVIAAVLALTIRRESPETALMISLGAGALILLQTLRLILDGADDLSVLLQAGGINAENIVILFKALGICFLTEFACDCASEAGLPSLCGNISLSGKALVLIASLPLLRQAIGMIGELLGN